MDGHAQEGGPGRLMVSHLALVRGRAHQCGVAELAKADGKDIGDVGGAGVPPTHRMPFVETLDPCWVIKANSSTQVH